MAQTIQHRRGPAGNLNSVTPLNGEIIVSTGSLPLPSGSVVHIGDGTTLGGIAAGRIYVGGTAPTVDYAVYGNAFHDLLWYDATTNALVRLDAYGPNEVLNLDGNTSGDNITLSGSLANGNTTSGNNIIINSNDIVHFESGSYVSGSIIPSAHLTYDLGRPGARWDRVYTRQVSIGTGTTTIIDGEMSSSATMSYKATGHYFDGDVFATGSFSGSFFGNGSGLSGVPTISTLAQVLTNGNTTSGTGITVSVGDTLTIAGAQVLNDDVNLQIGSSSGNGYLTYNTALIPSPGVVLANNSTNGYLIFNNADVTTLNGATTRIHGSSQITIGANTSELVSITAQVNSDIIPNGSGYDFGSGTNRWDYVYANYGNFNNDVTIAGDLYVQGTQTIVNSTVVTVDDNIIVINANSQANLDGGIYVYDQSGSYSTASLLWDSANDYWKAGQQNGEYRIVLQGSANPLTTDYYPKADANGNLVVGKFYDLGSTVVRSTVSIEPDADATWNLGAVAQRWNNIYGVNFIGTDLNVSSATGSFTGSFTGDGSGLTGVSSTDTLADILSNGNTTSGNDLTISSGDTLTITGDVGSSVLPDTDAAYNLGSATFAWNNVYGEFFYGDGSNLTNVPTVSTWATVLGNGASSGGTDVTISSGDTLFISGDVGSSVLPDTNATYNLGSATFQWNNIYGVNFIGTDLNVSSATGSFTGSFFGDGSGLTGITAEWDGTHTGAGQITGSLTVSGSAFITNVTNVDLIATNIIDIVAPTINLGAVGTENIVYYGTVGSDIIPSPNNTYDLGSASNVWAEIWGNEGNFTDLTVTNTISGNIDSADNISGGAANQVLYQSAPNTTTFTSAPTTAGDFLQWSGTALIFSNAVDGGTF